MGNVNNNNPYNENDNNGFRPASTGAFRRYHALHGARGGAAHVPIPPPRRAEAARLISAGVAPADQNPAEELSTSRLR